MTPREIKRFLEAYAPKKNRTIVIVDYSNVEKWKEGLGWKIKIQELANLIKHFSYGNQFLRRFYYGSDYGPDNKATQLVQWSESVLTAANMNRFEVITKRVKYIHADTTPPSYRPKCDLDVEMTVDLIKERDNYDSIILFSGDGDLMCAIDYLHRDYGKECFVFGARGYTGKEIFDAKASGVVKNVFFAEDFEHRLNIRH